MRRGRKSGCLRSVNVESVPSGVAVISASVLATPLFAGVRCGAETPARRRHALHERIRREAWKSPRSRSNRPSPRCRPSAQLLGDAVVAMAVAPLQEKLAARREREGATQQLKTATVLFMDVVGSTRLSERLDPEDAHAVMDTALERLTAIVRAHQGRVLQYAGDSLLAVFGADQALEDDAERAVRAGLAIVAEAAPLAAGFRSTLRARRLRPARRHPHRPGAARRRHRRRGKHSRRHRQHRRTHGADRARRRAQDQPRDVPARARRLRCRAAGADRDQGHHRARCAATSSMRAKPRAFRMANRGLEGIETQMVGRDAELARIGEAFLGACEDKTLRQVTIVGEPGIGKSRLGLEFTHWLELQARAGALLPGPAAAVRQQRARTACCATCSPGASRSSRAIRSRSRRASSPPASAPCSAIARPSTRP